MSDLILHHFDWSPYGEKVRVLLGLKRLSWRSVQIPMVMPKPDLTALTGGYRKTPVLQIGADIYCDTNCIARELEQRFPQPSFFPDGGPGLAFALAVWAEKFFEPGAGLSMGLNDQLPADLMQDRREFFSHMDFAKFAERTPHMFAQVLSNADLVEEQLADGRDFLTGGRPGTGRRVRVLRAVDGARLRGGDERDARALSAGRAVGGAHARDRPWPAHRH